MLARSGEITEPWQRPIKVVRALARTGESFGHTDASVHGSANAEDGGGSTLKDGSRLLRAPGFRKNRCAQGRISRENSTLIRLSSPSAKNIHLSFFRKI